MTFVAPGFAQSARCSTSISPAWLGTVTSSTGSDNVKNDIIAEWLMLD